MNASCRGQTLPLVGIAVLVLLGMTGFAVDTGYHQYQQRMQQTATDGAALAGAANLANGTWKAAALQDASTNGYTDNTGGADASCTDRSTIGLICVQVDNPPVSPDAFAGQVNAVEVQMSVNHPTFFERIFGFNTVPVTTKAVAITTQVDSGACVLVIDRARTANFNGTAGGGALTATQCGMVFNGGANFNNATVEAKAIECGSSASNCANGTFPSPYATPEAGYANDPCDAQTLTSSGTTAYDMPYCAYLHNDPPIAAGSTQCTNPMTPPAPDSTGTVTLPPGCYNGFSYHNSSNSPNLTVNFCGMYALTGTGNVSSNGSGAPPITITEPAGCPGVTFYVTGAGQINFRNAGMTLSPPSSGDYNDVNNACVNPIAGGDPVYNCGEQNVLIYQSQDDTNTGNLQSASCSGCASTVTGLMYFPSANLIYTLGGGSSTGGGSLIIAWDLNCNGCNLSVFEAPAAGGGLKTSSFLLAE